MRFEALGRGRANGWGGLVYSGISFKLPRVVKLSDAIRNPFAGLGSTRLDCDAWGSSVGTYFWRHWSG